MAEVGTAVGADDLGDVFGGFDLLWAALAVLTAWRMARPLGVRSRNTPISGL